MHRTGLALYPEPEGLCAPQLSSGRLRLVHFPTPPRTWRHRGLPLPPASLPVAVPASQVLAAPSAEFPATPSASALLPAFVPSPAVLGVFLLSSVLQAISG